MSLINDALKRANQNKPPVATGPSGLRMRPVEEPTPQRSGPSQWLLFLFPVLLLLVCGLAGVLIYRGWHGSDESSNQPGTITASAREVQPTPAPPTNDVAAAPPVAASATNITSAAAVAPEEPGFPDLKLQGVFYRPADPSALINSKTVRRGDTVQNARVIAISKSTVTVEWQGERRVLTMR
jgi:hypothetical protein